MRILIESWNYPPHTGGIEKVISHLHRGLERAGDEVLVLTRFAPDAATSSDNSGVYRAPRDGLGAFIAFALKRGWRLCRQSRPDVVLCGSLVSLPAGWLLARRFRLPLALIVYGSDLLQGGISTQLLIRWWLRRPEQIIAISRATAQLAVQRGVPTRRVTVIPPGIVPAALSRNLPQHIWDRWKQELQGRQVILSAGRLVRRKGFLNLVRDVMPRVVQRHPDVLLLIAGDEPTASLIHRERIGQELLQAITQLRLQEHVRLLGYVADDDLLALFRLSKLFVLMVQPALHDMEGFGIVFLEAAACGVPSVATHVGGVPDAIEHGVSGILTDPHDAGEFADSICRLLQDEDLRRQMGEAARRRAVEEFSWDKLAQRYHDTLHALCQAESRSAGAA